MNNIIKNKMEKEIMVIKNSIIFNDIKRTDGFYSNDEYENIGKNIMLNYKFMKRKIAETNFNYKQAITYAVIVDKNGLMFVYKRGGNKSSAGEKRLHNKISIGIGGHIEKKDINVSDNVITKSLIREISEELNMEKTNIKNIITIGYINDDSNDVGSVHIGICYLIEIYNNSFDLLDGEIQKGEFMSIKKLEKMIDSGNYNVENWSKILIEPIKNILNNN